MKVYLAGRMRYIHEYDWRNHIQKSGEFEITGPGKKVDITRKKDLGEYNRRAIQCADFVFAWLDYDWNEAYGTIWEIGYAKGIDKRIVIASPLDIKKIADLWFVLQSANKIISRSGGALESIRKAKKYIAGLDK